VSDYWTDRALPILRALDAPTDVDFQQTRILSLGNGGVGALGLDLSDDAVYDTILQLQDAGYVEFDDISREGGGGALIMGLRLSGRGMQVLGQWPQFGLLISPLTFAALLDALAEFAPEDEAKAMKRAGDIVKSLSAKAFRSLVFGVGGELVRNALGIP
jgi:hypothetical protein